MEWLRLHNFDDQGFQFPSRSKSIVGSPILGIKFGKETTKYVPIDSSFAELRQAVGNQRYNILWSGHGSRNFFQAPKKQWKQWGDSETGSIEPVHFARLLGICKPSRIVFFSCWGGLAAQHQIGWLRNELGTGVILNGPDVKLMGAQIELKVKEISTNPEALPWQITITT